MPVKKLVRKNSPQFVIKPLVPRNLTPTQNRSSFINMQMQNGATYAQAIRSWDTKARGNG